MRALTKNLSLYDDYIINKVKIAVLIIYFIPYDLSSFCKNIFPLLLSESISILFDSVPEYLSP